MPARITAVHAKGSHSFSKESVPRIELVAGQGVAGDAHCGITVKHRSRVARDPTQPNLRQVHLLHAELLDRTANGELVRKAGVMGVVLASGMVLPGDAIHIVEAPVQHVPLRPV